jgi:hypothetical protein
MRLAGYSHVRRDKAGQTERAVDHRERCVKSDDARSIDTCTRLGCRCAMTVALVKGNHSYELAKW